MKNYKLSYHDQQLKTQSEFSSIAYESRKVWKYFRRLFAKKPKSLEMLKQFSKLSDAQKDFYEMAPTVLPIDPNQVISC